ncbi:kinesin-like protein KIN-7D, chloroplastic isoform X1 [Zingiber officinale]|uniref:kinesin-like protein KIN-7D, chloroplastic isoform X1 n=1 Tax=Zingiber officinale TaxID=94328 RepID=UPI001C4CC52D|nr:kinesin-like protein KIN-7D, chloroplastic isoform X1 [Zingiber officinale]
MASRYDSRQRRTVQSPASYKPANSPTSSTTSSFRQVPEASADGQSSPASSTARGKPQYFFPDSEVLDADGSKENVTVTVRFRPLSQREIRQGEEIAWYADGDTIVRSEHNPTLAYAYDRVFGPTTTTRHVYDVAAQHVVGGAMEGINGTIFAYGVTSSGKTHTMHGDQRSPGIIPLAVKDAFSIIQETPSREFLLRVSYLEIYNEVVNDLLNPAGQNLRIREDTQGTFIEGIKEEVVLSPAHALSLIAAGEEHRHVGSNNFNLLSSRSHTIFTLTIESSPCGDCGEGEAVNFSQLNLIDLAGSESSRAETTGVRRKEGSYINKSLLTLGTVIAKLTDGKATHIPYRDSKLTRLLQSSLSGQGRVSLICTVTPSSSNAEETHNTLKFAHRAKCIEIQASQNKILDEKSLIKKYQNEIRCLKQELDQLKKGIVTVNPHKDTGEDDIFILKQKLEDGHVKLQSRLEQEEEAKAALLGRIQRLTKLILVSTKASQSPRFLQHPGSRRRHSFGEEELAYLPYRRRDMILDNETAVFYAPIEGFGETNDDILKEEKKNRKHGLLNWFKSRKRDGGTALTSSDGDKSSGTKSHTTPTPQAESTHLSFENGLSNSLVPDSIPADLLLEVDHDRELPADNLSSQETPMTSIKTIDHLELLKEQLKILAGEVALHSSILKRLSDEAAKNPKNEQIQMDMRKVKEEIKVKNQQIISLEKQMANSLSVSHNSMRNSGVSPSYTELQEQLNEKTLELEVKTADNSIIQDQLLQKIHKCEELQETITSLKQQLAQALEMKDSSMNVKSQYHFEETFFHEMRTKSEDGLLNDTSSKLQHEEDLVSEIKELKQKVSELTEANSQLEARNQKLAEEGAYARGLASAAGVELKALSEEVTKLMNHNERLAAELASTRNSTQRRASSVPRNTRRESHIKRHEPTIKREVNASYERELEAALLEKEQREAEIQKKLEESKQKEAFLENELANMWVLVAKLKKPQGNEPEVLDY